MKYLDNTGLSYLWSKIKPLINAKQNKLVSGTNIKTVNNQSILGSGNINIVNTIYPVGSIYMSVTETSPETFSITALNSPQVTSWRPIEKS